MPGLRWGELRVAGPSIRMAGLQKGAGRKAGASNGDPGGKPDIRYRKLCKYRQVKTFTNSNEFAPSMGGRGVQALAV